MQNDVLRAAVICMNLPYPVNNGTRLRCLSVIESLKAMGYEVTVIYPMRRHVKKRIGDKLGVSGEIIVAFGFFHRKWLELKERIFKNTREDNYSYNRVSICLRSKLELKKLPVFDLVVTEYARTSSVSRHIKAKHHILDTCDILSFYYIKAQKLKLAMNRYLVDGNDKSFSRLEILDGLRYSNIRPKELSDFKKHDSTIAIAESEFDMFQQIGLPNVRLIPPCVSMPSKAPQDYLGLPIFPFSGNIFNVQGLFHFKEHILPLIIREEPDFRMVITGKTPEGISNCPHFICSGHVEDLGELYRQSGFAIVPVFNGTGQQLKIPELMSYGIPVVTYRMRVDPGIMTHGRGGLLAENETEFKDHVLRLWRDRKLAEEMGRVAEEIASTHLSQSHFNAKMRELICSLKGMEK